MGSVGERGEDDHLAVPGIDRLAALVRDHLAQRTELGIACSIDLLGGGDERSQPVAILDQILPPAHEIHILEQHLHLATHDQALEGWIVEIQVLDLEFFYLFRLRLDACERSLHVAELALHGKRKRGHSALHALEHIDAQQVDQALFTVHLAEETGTTLHLRTILAVVGLLFMRQHVAQGGIRS